MVYNQLSEQSVVKPSLPSPYCGSIAVIGLGYVGLPLAVAFANAHNCVRTDTRTNRKVIGFDINDTRIEELLSGHDRTCEVSSQSLSKASSNLWLTSDPSSLCNAEFFIVTVPTPIDSQKEPDLIPLERASITVGQAIASQRQTIPIIIFESTVYPGVTEEICAPIIEKSSGKKLNSDFFVGYSPERINPGDKTHQLENIVKVTSGSSPQVAEIVDQLYASIIRAGTHKASCIKVAEAAKVIENTQRDINIALMNELSVIFTHMNIDTQSVLEAASTKWNFLPFKPGLVGGHCIGVDPYYLTYASRKHGYYPQIILSGRTLNDSMGKYVAEQTKAAIQNQKSDSSNIKVLILGLAFKENCPDLRNTGVISIIANLAMPNCEIDVFDPLVSFQEAEEVYGIILKDNLTPKSYDAVIFAVAHREFIENKSRYINLAKDHAFIYDLKHILTQEESTRRL